MASVACGGGAAAGKGAATPTQGAPTDVAANGNSPAPAGGQYGIGDAPTNGESASNRPKMKRGRRGRVHRGHGGLQERGSGRRKNQFTQATQADPKAYQAFYSLGVVRERLNESSGALTSYRQATTVVADYEPRDRRLLGALGTHGQAR